MKNLKLKLLTVLVGIFVLMIAAVAISPTLQVMLAYGMGSIYEKYMANTPEEDAAYIARAVAEKDLSLCRKVSGIMPRSARIPQADCYLEVAKAAGGPDICLRREIEDSVGSAQCFLVLAVSMQDVSICGRLDSLKDYSSGDCVEDYYFDSAMLKKDPALCRKLKEAPRRGYCLETLAAIKAEDAR